MPEQTLDLEQLNELFHEYSEADLVCMKRNTAAFANDVYDIVDSGGQRFVLRILKTQLPETVAMEAEMQGRLAAAGVGTPRYLQIQESRYVGEYAGKLFTLSKYIEGATPASASLELVKEFGAITAQLHAAWEGITPPFSKMQWFNPANARQDLDAYAGPLKDDLRKLLGAGSRLFTLDLPKTVIHADLWLGNVFADGSKITAVFDLETAEYTIRTLDLARTFLSMRLETGYTPQQITDALFTGYDSRTQKPLTQEEKTSFELATAYSASMCALWHARHGTRYVGPYIKFGQEALGAKPCFRQ